MDTPRGVEILIKKAAVDPTFKKLLFEKRAGAADAIALKLEPVEVALLEATPAAQLEAIVANTKVSPRLRPAFLGYAAAAMLAAVGASTSCSKKETERSDIDMVKGHTVAVFEDKRRADPEEIPTGEIPDGKGVITGVVYTPGDYGVSDVIITLRGTDSYAIPGEGGDFIFNMLAPGKYDIIVGEFFTKEEIVSYRDIEVRAGERTPLWIPIEDGSHVPGKCAPDSLGIRPDIPPDRGRLYSKDPARPEGTGQ